MEVAQKSPAFASPADAVRALAGRLEPVGCETVPLAAAGGRILAQRIVADRPSPPSDVSAMDGYAVRLSDIAAGRLEVCASVLPGRPAPAIVADKVMRIMTGAVVPSGAEAVIRREDVVEEGEEIVVPGGLDVRMGQNIRRRGENLAAGATVLEQGREIDSAVVTVLASFGVAGVAVRRKVRVAVIVTGDELLPPDAQAQPWQIRDSNGPALQSMLGHSSWIEFPGPVNVADEYESLLAAVREQLERCDVLWLTGGVSAGTHDFVPAALHEVGCELVFHRLPQRPGGPLLGAVGPSGQAVLGLPGNPQSVMTSARRIGAAVLRCRAGFAEPIEHRPTVTLSREDGRALHLWWYRPVRLIAAGQAELVETRGSGDVVAAARSNGFIEVPPHQTGPGPWPFYGWSFAP